MKLIGDIINELVSNDTSLEPPLLKTKVLATRINNSELLSWVENELSGYNNIAVPEYRKDTAQITGSFIYGRFKYSDCVLSLEGLSEQQYRMLTTHDWVSGVRTLEHLTTGKTQKLVSRLPTWAIAMIQRGLENLGNHGVHVYGAQKETSQGAVHECLSAIRKRLLEFMLKLEKEFGEQAEIEQLRTNKTQINHMMNQTFYNNGEGIVINTGNNNALDVKLNINKGNKDELRSRLLENGIESEDVNELLSVIDQEQSSTDGFSAKVNSWLGKMLMKAANGGWQVAIGTAGNMLATLLQQYYGH